MRKKNWAKGSDVKFLSKLRKGDKVYIADSEWRYINGLCIVTGECHNKDILVSNIIDRTVGQNYNYPCFAGEDPQKKTTISLWNPNDKR